MKLSQEQQKTIGGRRWLLACGARDAGLHRRGDAVMDAPS